jgi:SAM-dependent methyltransferase
MATMAPDPDIPRRLTAELYDIAFENRVDLEFFLSAVQDYGGPVLEVGCGTGRIVFLLARHGFTVHGFDRSLGRLQRAKETLGSLPSEIQNRITLSQDDMRSFSLGKRFQTVLVAFRTFQHLLTVDEQLSALHCFRSHLDLEGYLILDVFNPSIQFLAEEESNTEVVRHPSVQLRDGSRLEVRDRIVKKDLFNQILHSEEVYCVRHSGGETERFVLPFSVRYIFRYELEHLLERSGFTVESIYSSFARTPYGSHYPGELIIVARPT